MVRSVLKSENIILRLRNSKFYVGNLEDFVEVNPSTSRVGLEKSTPVSFVPMPAVEEKTNSVTYTIKAYEEVKTGFTVFQREKGETITAPEEYIVCV